jgi:uncharacterized membrane protein
MTMHDVEQRSTATVPRFAAALIGGALISFARRGAAGTASRFFGAGLLAAVFVPTLATELRRVGSARRRVQLRTTLVLDRPVREVFTFCQDFENFPRVVQSLRRIIDYRDGRSHWEVSSPTGELIAWEAEVTKYVPNSVIAWQSLSDATVDCGGVIRFSPTESDGTCLEIDVHYDPLHTGLAEAVRALLDTPREQQLRADLERANFYLESQPALPPPIEEPETGGTAVTV